MRKTFRCQFNRYVDRSNRDGVLSSLLSQFQGYDCNPEITLEDDSTFTLTVDIGGELTSTLVRDKLAFNYFVNTVRAVDEINKIRKMILPKPVAKSVNLEGIMDIFSGKLDNENIELPEGARPDIRNILGSTESTTFISSWVKQADPTGEMIVPPFSGQDEPIEVDFNSDVRDVTASRLSFVCPFCEQLHSRVATRWTEENGALPGKRRPTTTRDTHPDYVPPSSRDWTDESLWRRGPATEGDTLPLHPEEIPAVFQVPGVDRIDPEAGFVGDELRDLDAYNQELCPKCLWGFEPLELVGRYIDEDQDPLDRGDKLTKNVPFHSDCLQQMRNACTHLRRLDDSHFEFGPAQELWQRVKVINANRPSRFTPFNSHRRTATEQDGGGLSGFGDGPGLTNIRTDLTSPRKTKDPKPSILGVPVNSWFTDDVLSGETITPGRTTEAPLITTDLAFAASKDKVETEEDRATVLDLPEATQGGTILGLHGWSSASKNNYFLGLGEDYTVEENFD